MSVRDSSIEAYHQLKREGKISEKRSEAFNALKEYAEAEGTDRWPTALELYEWAQGHIENDEFSFSRFGNFKPRITELKPGSDATDTELVEELGEKREQDSDTTDQKAYPVKILSYQSTLSSQEGEAAELQQESTGYEPSQEDTEIEIPYEVNGGNEVQMGPPSEAIEETDNLESVVEMLEAKDLLDEYQAEVEAARSGSEVSSEDDVDDSEVVETEMDYVFDTDEDYQPKKRDEVVSNDGENETKDSGSPSDETKADDEVDNQDSGDEQQVLMKDGEVVC